MRTREISVFIDESGCYEHNSQSSRYYLVCMVFHDQDIDISAEIEKLERSLESMGLNRTHCVHAGPLIRREQEYAEMPREERRGIFRRMFLFLHNVDISYKCFTIDKQPVFQCSKERKKTTPTTHKNNIERHARASSPTPPKRVVSLKLLLRFYAPNSQLRLPGNICASDMRFYAYNSHFRLRAYGADEILTLGDVRRWRWSGGGGWKRWAVYEHSPQGE